RRVRRGRRPRGAAGRPAARCRGAVQRAGAVRHRGGRGLPGPAGRHPAPRRTPAQGTARRRPALTGRPPLGCPGAGLARTTQPWTNRRGPSVRCMTRISLKVDGAQVSDDVEPRLLLVQYLREQLGKTGTVIGCDTSNCGACTVHLNGTSVKSCNVLAVQADGGEVTTIEGMADGQWHPLQQAFHAEHALQCGYCTPGMIMAAADLLRSNPHPSNQEIREGLEGNL